MSSEKRVKVYVRVADPKSGREVLVQVGKSRPDQVQLLRKHGMAEWVRGKIVLNLQASQPAQKSEAVAQNPCGEVTLPEASPVNHLSDPWRASSFSVDPETGDPVPPESLSPLPEEVVCESAGEWFSAMAEARSLGSEEVNWASDPRTRRLGFIAGGRVYYLGLARLRSAREEDTEPMRQFGLSHTQVMECLGSPQGQALLLDSEGGFFDYSRPVEEALPIPEAPPTPSMDEFLEWSSITPISLGDGGGEESPFWTLVLQGLAASGAEILQPEEEPAPPSLPTSEELLASLKGLDWELLPEGVEFFRDLRNTLSNPDPNSSKFDFSRAVWASFPVEDLPGNRGPCPSRPPENSKLVWVAKDLEPLANDRPSSRLVGEANGLRTLYFAWLEGGTWYAECLYNESYALQGSEVHRLLVSFKRAGLYRVSGNLVPKEEKIPFGWAKFAYPKDKDRVPLLAPDGAPYEGEIRGLFRRKGNSIEILTEQGEEIKAHQKDWVLAEGNPEMKSGYALERLPRG
jgi:hypothetical protein